MIEYSDEEGDNLTPPEPIRKRKSDNNANNDSNAAAPKKKPKTSTQSSKRKSQASEGGSKKKRQKLLADDLEGLELAFDVTIPDGHADWVPGAVALLASTDFGGQWKALVGAWLSFEHSRKYAATMLPATSRPSAIGDWIARARPHTYRPVINIKTFQSGFEMWWRSFQPEWRLQDSNGGLAKSASGTWDSMQYTGANGLLSVLAALFFWGTSNPNEKWHAAVNDVMYALQSML